MQNHANEIRRLPGAHAHIPRDLLGGHEQWETH